MDARFAEPAVLTATARRDRANLAAAGAGAAALVAAFVIHPSAVDDGPVVCPFRLLTGLPCPGCGLTRSWVHLAHGQWGDALTVNPFGIISMAAVVVFVVVVAGAFVRRTPLPDLGRLTASRPAVVLGVAWIAYGAGRLVWTVAG